MSFTARQGADLNLTLAHNEEGVKDWTTVPAKQQSRFMTWVNTLPESKNVQVEEDPYSEAKLQLMEKMTNDRIQQLETKDRQTMSRRAGKPLGARSLLGR